MISVKKALLSFLVTAAAATPSSAAEDFRYSRTLAVEAPGWMRLLLDGPAQAHGWQAQDWRILDADGKSMPRALLEPLSGWIGANALSVNEDAATGTYLLVFDIGPTPVEHRQLRVELDKAFRAGGCRHAAGTAV